MRKPQNDTSTGGDRGIGTGAVAAAVLAALFSQACGGGPRAVLHDVVDEAAAHATSVLAELQASADEVREITGRELEACMERYRARSFGAMPGYADVVPRPEGLGVSVIGGLPYMGQEDPRHRSVCGRAQGELSSLGTEYDAAVAALTAFGRYADALRDAIDEATDDRIEALSRSIEAMETPQDNGDALLRRYQRLETALRPRGRRLGPELRTLLNDEPIVTFAIITFALEEYSAAGFRRKWTTLLENHAAAKRYSEVLHAYMRQIYEGPDH